jgi:hypothetical protein
MSPVYHYKSTQLQSKSSESNMGDKGNKSAIKNISELSILVLFFSIVALVVGWLIACNSDPPSYRLVREVVAGGVSASVASFLFFPINVVNIRLQTTSSNATKKFGVLKMMNIIFQSEGFQGLWASGIVANCVRSFIHQGLRLGLFPSMKTYIILSLTTTIPLISSGSGGGAGESGEIEVTTDQHQTHFLLEIVAGMITGGLSAALCNPLDLVEVLMNSEGRSKYTNSLDAMVQVIKQQGYSGLWRAGSLTTIRAAMASGAQLAFYDYAKWVTHPYSQVNEYA